MPLVRLFARAHTKIPLEPLQASLSKITPIKGLVEHPAGAPTVSV